MKLNVGLFNESFPPTIDGVSNCVLNYASYITKNHGRCTVVTPKYPHVTDDYPFEVYRYSSADISKNLEYRVGNMFSVKTIRDLYTRRFDIIHVHSPFTSSVIVSELKKIRRDIPVVFTYHTKFDIDFKSRLKVPALCKTAERFICHNISQADEVWVVSEGAAQSLRNIGYKGEYRVMKNGTDFKRGKSSDEKIAELKKEYGVAENEKLMLFVGRMMWYKNTGLILDALNLLPKDLPYKMIFVGDGADRTAMEDYADRLGLGDKVIFAGAVKDREKVRTFFSAADLFLFPSTYDTAGLVVMEAAACELPSVLVDGSCAAEDVVDDFSGYLCEENAESLCNKIEYALSDDEKLKTVGQNAAKYVYLSWEDSVARAYKRYCEIYNEFHSGTVKKSLIEKAMPENIKTEFMRNVRKGSHTARRVGRQVSNAGKKAAGNVAGGVKYSANATKHAAVGVAKTTKSAAVGVASTTKNAAVGVANAAKGFAKGVSNAVVSSFSSNDIRKDIPVSVKTDNNKHKEHNKHLKGKTK